MKFATLVIAGSLVAWSSAASAQQINDAQIAAIVVTANQVDIDAGKLAVAQSTNADVKDFGQQMVTGHTGVNKSATELVTNALDHAYGHGVVRIAISDDAVFVSRSTMTTRRRYSPLAGPASANTGAAGCRS